MSKSSRYFDEAKQINVIVNKVRAISNKNNEEILQFSQYDDNIHSYFQQNGEANSKVVVDKIELAKSENEINNIYDLTVNLGGYADSSKQSDIDLLQILLNEENSLNIYKIQEISSCFNFSINIILNKNIEEDLGKITLGFTRNARGRSFTLNFSCTFSSQNKNIIFCQIDREIPSFNFTFVTYINYDENTKKVISITTEDENSLFLIYCTEKPPIAAIIFIPSMFVFIVIVVIVIIIFLNKKGRGEKGYEPPSNISNNIIGLSSAAISK